MSAALTIILLASISSGAFGFQCPEGQYLYRNCSVCFFPSPPDHTLSFEDASSYCATGGGALLSFGTQGDLYRVNRYLEGLQQDRREFWVGYRHNASDERVAEDGGPASHVVLNTTNFITDRTQPGPFRCIGVKGGKFFTRSCTREVRFICEYFYTVSSPEVSPENETVYARLGSNITLSATIPFPGVSRTEWKRNGSVITSNGSGIEIRRTNMESGQILYTTLTIKDFNTGNRHSGAYALTVQNAAGVAMVMEWQVREAVLGPLTFEPSDLNVVREQIAAFECHAPNSAPPPTVRWFKDSSQQPLESSGRVFVSQETGTLFIREVAAGDAGMYHCVVENLAGTRTSRRARLRVDSSFPAGVTSPGQVSFYFQPRNQSVALGDPFVVDCVGRFTASPLLMTILSHKNLTVPDQIFMYPDNTGFPQFRIDSVGLESDGICYVCGIFHNHYLLDTFAGNLIIGTSVVTIYAAAFISDFYTEWNGMTSTAISQSIPPGSDVTIYCSFDGRPRPASSAVEWYQDGMRINSGVSTSDSNSTLTISDFSSSTVYQCHVTNMHGSDMASVFLCLQQQDVLPDVVSFRVMPDTNSSIYVEWTGDRSGTHPLLLRYLVSIFGPLANGSTEMNFNLLSEARSLVIEELQPNEAYQVAVKTSSLKGTTEPPRPQRVSTFPNAPSEPFPDSNVRALRTEDNTLLVVTWDTFTPLSGPPLPEATSYQVEVEYQRLGGAGGRSMSITVNGTERQAVISLSSANAESFQVRIRVAVQSQRDPRAYSYSPWTSYIQVSGLTTPPVMMTPAVMDGIMNKPVSAMLLIYILIPVGVVLLVLLTVMLVLGIYCWYRRRPDGVYSISNSEKRRKKTDSFKAVSTTVPHLSQPSPTPVTYATVSRDNIDFGSVPNTTTDHMRYGVTISVVDTNSVERDQTHATESWMEEFDHLETLVTTLNDTVTSMAGNGVPRTTDGSDTSLVINNTNTGLHHGRMISHDDEGTATLHKMNLDSGRATAHSGEFNSASSSSVEASPRPLVMRGMAGSHSDTEEGSQTSIVKQNLAAPDPQNGSAEINTSTPLESGTRNQSLENFPFHSGSHSSMSTIEILVDTQDMREEEDEEGAEFGSIRDVYNSTALEEADVKLGTLPSEGFHSNATLEVGSTEEIAGMGSKSRSQQVKREVKSDNDDIEFDENLMELLKYGNKQDLTLV